MAKVDLPDNLLAGFVPGMLGRKTSEGGKASGAKGSFKVALRDAEKADGTGTDISAEPFTEAELGEMLDGVFGLGEELKRNPSPDAVTAYKRAVRNFVHHVVERSYKLEERSSARDVLKRKKFSSLSVVDEKLERLAAEVISAQRSQLDILGRIDEINGMLVDLIT